MKKPHIRPLASSGSTVIIIMVVAVIVIALACGVFVITKSSAKGALSTNPSACVNKTLTVGSSGTCVSDAQNLLNWQVYGINQPGYMKVDGQYTSAVAGVVSKLQDQSQLEKNGNVGHEEWKLLCQAEEPPTWWTSAAKDAGCTSS
jgi:hypothetical protein